MFPQSGIVYCLFPVGSNKFKARTPRTINKIRRHDITIRIKHANSVLMTGIEIQ